MATKQPLDDCTTAALLDRLGAVGVEQGLTVTARGGTLTGRREAILSKWFLGGRKVVYAMSCQVDEAAHSLRFREVEAETSWGIPPPSLTVERTTLKGTQLSGTRRDVAPGGGGSLDYAAVRRAVEEAVRATGWTFSFEAGRMPEGAPSVKPKLTFGGPSGFNDVGGN